MAFFICIFSKWRKTHQNKTKKKVAYLSKYWFDFDEVYIKLYIFCDAEAIYEVPEESRGHAAVVAVKVKVILAK